MDLKELIEKLKDPIEKSYCKTKKISTKKILYGIFRNYDDPDDKYQVFDCSLESIVSEYSGRDFTLKPDFGSNHSGITFQ